LKAKSLDRNRGADEIEKQAATRMKPCSTAVQYEKYQQKYQQITLCRRGATQTYLRWLRVLPEHAGSIKKAVRPEEGIAQVLHRLAKSAINSAPAISTGTPRPH
jgi:hypothetical protein